MDPTSVDAVALARLGWLMVCSALVLFMQAGFCCLEAGLVRHKNSINVAIKNLVDLLLSGGGYFVIGFSLMFGTDLSGMLGEPVAFLGDAGPAQLAAFVYQVTFCSTAATIVSGAVAERCRFLPYMLLSALVGILIYPVFGHWAWGGGWLMQMGYHDFAGSSVVHMCGGMVALAGIQTLGPRRGRFDAQGRPRPMPASSMPLAALGTFILLFGWIGFNGGSAPLGESTARIITCTIVAGFFGGLAGLLLSWAFNGLSEVDQILNGLLGGLVCITASADAVPPQTAALIGLIGGAVAYAGSKILERMRLDDSVGAVPVHGIAGGLGVILTALFAPSEFLAAKSMARVEFLKIQAIGVLTCLAWAWSTGLVAWTLISKFTKLRVGPEEEELGLNFSEHRVGFHETKN